MKILEDKIKVNTIKSKIFDTYFKGQSFCVYDIETMGLTVNNEIILASIGVLEDDELKITQYFLDSLEEEPLLLSNVISELNKYDFVITYNGRFFDIPFTNKRAKILELRQLGLNDEVKLFDFDLLLILRYYSELHKILPNLRQKEVESFLGLSDSRLDEISGKESIDLFKEYLMSNDFKYREKLAEKILLHNHDDVLMLYKILDVIKYVDLNKALSKQGFPILGLNGWKTINISKIDIKNSRLIIKGMHYEENFSYMQFSPYEAEFRKDQTFEISVPLLKIENGLVINLKEYDLDNSQLKELGNYVNDYLILKDNIFNYLEINLVSREILNSLMKELPR